MKSKPNCFCTCLHEQQCRKDQVRLPGQSRSHRGRGLCLLPTTGCKNSTSPLGSGNRIIVHDLTREAAREILLRWRSTWWALGKQQTSRAQLEREEPPSPCSSKTSTSAIRLHWRDMRTAVMSPGLLKPRPHPQGLMATDRGCRTGVTVACTKGTSPIHPPEACSVT